MLPCLGSRARTNVTCSTHECHTQHSRMSHAALTQDSFDSHPLYVWEDQESPNGLQHGWRHAPLAGVTGVCIHHGHDLTTDLRNEAEKRDKVCLYVHTYVQYMYISLHTDSINVQWKCIETN